MGSVVGSSRTTDRGDAIPRGSGSGGCQAAAGLFVLVDPILFTNAGSVNDADCLEMPPDENMPVIRFATNSNCPADAGHRLGRNIRVSKASSFTTAAGRFPDDRGAGADAWSKPRSDGNQRDRPIGKASGTDCRRH